MKTSEKDDLWMKIGKKLTYSINDFFLFIFIFHDSHNAKKKIIRCKEGFFKFDIGELNICA